MKLKERETDNFFIYLKKGFSKFFRFFFNKRTKNLYLTVIVIIALVFGIFIGLVVSGYFGTFDQPSGNAYRLLVTLGIDDPHELKVLTEGILKQNIKIPINYIKGQLSDPKQLYINIQFTDYKKIEFKREQALELGVLVSSGADYVPADIIYNEKKYSTEIRLKGDLPDHWDGDKWSLRVRVKGNDTLLGMSVFSLQDPATRQEINEMVYQRALQEEGVIGLRYDFVEVFINGENKGIYALEEHFSKELIEHNNRRESIIIKFDEDVHFEDSVKRSSLSFEVVEAFYGSPITAFESERELLNDSLKLNQFNKAMSLLESLREGSLEPHEIFDVDITAKYFAISTLMNCPHSKAWHNARIYYNPITSLLEPIGFDGNCRRDGAGAALKEYIPDCIYLQNNQSGCSFKEGEFSDLILSDGIIFERYVAELERMSKQEYMDNLLNKLDKEIKEALKTFYREIPFYYFSEEGYYQSQRQIRDMLSPLQGINVYLEKSTSSKKIILSLGNTNLFPIKILNMDYNGTIFPLISDKKILQPRNLSKLPEYKHFEFEVSTNLDWVEEYALDSVVNYNVFGTDQIKNVSIFPWPYVEDNFIAKDFLRQKSNLSSFEMLKINEEKKLIVIKEGLWKLDTSLIIPEGFFVVADKKITIDLVNNSMILSRSAITFKGSEQNPIRITSSDKTGQGLTILNAEGKSYLEHVIFSNLINPSKGGWELSGAVNFHESNVEFKSVSFQNILSEDALNIIASDFEIKDSIFEDCGFDCFDSDFNNGFIKNSVFEDCGNDCIDFSGSDVEMENITIYNAGDKGISIGEKSNISAENIEIKGDINIAIACKDISESFFGDVNISNAKYGFAVYQKKSEYGPASITATNVNLNNVENKYIVEEKSNLLLNGIIILDNKQNVYNTLYL